MSIFGKKSSPETPGAASEHNILEGIDLHGLQEGAIREIVKNINNESRFISKKIKSGKKKFDITALTVRFNKETDYAEKTEALFLVLRELLNKGGVIDILQEAKTAGYIVRPVFKKEGRAVDLKIEFIIGEAVAQEALSNAVEQVTGIDPKE